MCLWYYEEFLNMLPPGRIPLALLIKISLKSLRGKKEKSIRKGSLLFPFHSVSIPSPQSLWVMTEGWSLCWGWCGWRELLYPVELLKCLSFWAFHELWILACHSSQQLHTPHTIPTIPCSHNADLTGQMEPILSHFQSLSALTFSCLQFFQFSKSLVKEVIHILGKLCNAAHKVTWESENKLQTDLVWFQSSFDANCWVSLIHLWLSIKPEFKTIFVS